MTGFAAAATATVAPPHGTDPPTVAARLSGSGLLGEHVVYERDGFWRIGARPVGRIRADRTHVYTDHEGEHRRLAWTGTPWQQVASALADCPVPDRTAFGWVCFDMTAPRTADGDLLHLMVPGLQATLDAGEVTVTGDDPDLVRAVARLAASTQPFDGEAEPVPIRVDGARYREAVARAVDRIRSGYLEKVVLSRSVLVDGAVDLPATYALGRAHNTPARSFLLDLGGWQAAGFSPESLVEVAPSGQISTQPLAGTAARDPDPARNAALRAALLTDPKEVYEHATSVRLALEELGSVAAAGSTRVKEFLSVQQRGSVQHLGSRVSAQLADGLGPWDALGAVFPAVTASGIPKPQATDLIRELEDGPRGLYAGAVLTADADGGLDAALVLRGIYRRGGSTWLRAGAGVVAPSRPEREYEETCEKLASVAPYVVRTR